MLRHESDCLPCKCKDLSEAIEDHILMSLAEERLSSGGEASAIPEEEVMAELGISKEDIDAADDQEID